MTPDMESTTNPTIHPLSSDQPGGVVSQSFESAQACERNMPPRLEATAQLDGGDTTKLNPIQPCSQAHLDYLVNWLREQGIEPSEPKDELARIRKILRTLPEGLTPSMMADPK